MIRGIDDVRYESLDDKMKGFYRTQAALREKKSPSFAIRERMWKYCEDDAKGFLYKGKPYLPYEDGKSVCLLSAPHAVMQLRDGRLKSDDQMTGPLTEELCERAGVRGLIRTRFMEDDPNKDLTGPGMAYKKKLLSMVKKESKVFIDIHGASDRHGFAFCLGTNMGKNLNGGERYADLLEESLSALGPVIRDLKGFRASSNGNVSRFMAENSGICAIQLEIARSYRMDEEKMFAFLDAMEAYIRKIKRL